MEAIQKISNLLEADEKKLHDILALMEKLTGKEDVVNGVVKESDAKIFQTTNSLGIKNVNAEELIHGIEEFLYKKDRALYEIFNKPDLTNPENAQLITQKAYQAVNNELHGTFLKKDRARAMLKSTPPERVITLLGYQGVDELLEKEPVEEIFAAMRFVETREWMNTVFLKEYETLTPEDFEERSIELIVLNKKWLSVAQEFLHKKHHNVSHLKELGIVFIIPIPLDVPGDTLRMFSLVLHYLYEVPFYARLIERYIKDPVSFSSRFISFIRGDVGQESQEFNESRARWLIIQRYLAKENPDDRLLSIPHVNPEAIHWAKAQHALMRVFSDVSMFYNLDSVGDFFLTSEGALRLVSFDLVDNIMGLVEPEVKFFYHYREALWNKLFIEFMGQEAMEKLIIENLDKGFIEFNS